MNTAENASPATPARITTALTPQAAAALVALRGRTGLSITDIVNRAITLYDFTDSQQREGGRDLLLRDKGTGELQLVWFL